MEKMVLQPLTEKEKADAEKWHDLIYCFLHQYGYSIEEYYNVAVFGLLKGVQVWNRKKEIQNKVQIQHVIWTYLRAECSNYTRTENAKKRKPEEPIMSLNAEEGWHDCIGGKSVEDEFLEREMIGLLFNELTENQRKIVEKRMAGYDNTEIIILLKISASIYYRELNKIKSILEKCIA